MATDKKCLRCGGTQLQPGKLQSTGGVCFEPDIVKTFAFSHSVEVRATICLDCGTVELVGDTQKVRSLTGIDKSK